MIFVGFLIYCNYWATGLLFNSRFAGNKLGFRYCSTLIMTKHNNGFTLIEVVAAVSLVTIGSLGVFSLIERALINSTSSLYRLTAIYLAQEGIEIVKNIRDSNWIIGLGAWDDSINCGILPCEYEADHTNISFLDVYFEPGNFLNIETDPVLGKKFFQYSSDGMETRFKRKITVSNCFPVSSACLNVSVLVSWHAKGKSNQIIIQENLYNYR